MKIDVDWFQRINGFAKRSRALDLFAKFAATYIGPLLLVLVALIALWLRNWEMLIVAMCSMVVARFLIDQVVYSFYKRKRPMEALNITPLIHEPNYPSFPSGHASVFFALSFSLLPYSLSLGVTFIGLSLIMVFFRVFAGVHWPSDIVAGIICGWFSFVIVFFFKTILLS